MGAGGWAGVRTYCFGRRWVRTRRRVRGCASEVRLGGARELAAAAAAAWRHKAAPLTRGSGQRPAAAQLCRRSAPPAGGRGWRAWLGAAGGTWRWAWGRGWRARERRARTAERAARGGAGQRSYGTGARGKEASTEQIERRRLSPAEGAANASGRSSPRQPNPRSRDLGTRLTRVIERSATPSEAGSPGRAWAVGRQTSGRARRGAGVRGRGAARRAPNRTPPPKKNCRAPRVRTRSCFFILIAACAAGQRAYIETRGHKRAGSGIRTRSCPFSSSILP